MRKLLVVFFLALFSLSVSAQSLWTTDRYGNNQLDFPPDSYVYFHGSGFEPSEKITITITKPDFLVTVKTAFTDNIGDFVYRYDLEPMEGRYHAFATDGTNEAATFFTDDTIWTTDGSSQQKNSFACGEQVGLDGNGLSVSKLLNYTICDSPGGNPCNGLIVKEGQVTTDSQGDIQFTIIWTVPIFYPNGSKQHKVVVFDSPAKSKTFDVECECVDSDQDNFPGYDENDCMTGNDCDDTDPSINPAASEVCDDGFDNDCDGASDCADTDCDCTSTCSVDDDCDDLNACTQDSCDSGSCTYSALSCNDANSCTVDSCDSAVGCIFDQAAAEGGFCDDGLFCTQGETCQAGTCIGGSATDCSIFGDQCNLAKCDEVNDICYSDPQGGISCDDSKFCTTGDECLSGICQGGLPPDCSDLNQCTADSCNITTDSCQNDNLPLGTSCGDFRTCPTDQCTGHFAVIYPSSGQDTCDGSGLCIELSCLQETSYCSDDDPDDGVNSITCGAACDQDSDCPDTRCDRLDGCYDGRFRDYHDQQNICLGGCECSENVCQFTLPGGDMDADGVDDECDICPGSKEAEPVDVKGCDPFQFCEQYSCGLNCYDADFVPIGSGPEDTIYPGDCTVVVLSKEGDYYPICTPTTCAD